jgi:hypothetical protein
MASKKHVIILGAGASKTSGYPLANDLTLLMCDRKTFIKELDRITEEASEHDVQRWRLEIETHYDSFRGAASMLRAGDFRTMDEMSKFILHGKSHSHIQDLKALMRFVFALNNAELDSFATSDYRRFVQSLLTNEGVRKDVSILSFNYDPFLEHRLHKAFATRQYGTNKVDQARMAESHAIFSGFSCPSDLTWLAEDGFCHLKLHGTATFSEVNHPELTSQNQLPVRTGHFYDIENPLLRLWFFTKAGTVLHPPPVLLPWEIIHEKEARILNEQEFVDKVGDGWKHKDLYPLFRGIWERARKEIFAAAKVSFVGLSLNPFLDPVFRYLFEGKKGNLVTVVANPANEDFRNSSKGRLHPASPSGLVNELLSNKVNAELKLHASASEVIGGLFDMAHFESAMKPYEPRITTHNLFSEFIEKEMIPPS